MKASTGAATVGQKMTSTMHDDGHSPPRRETRTIEAEPASRKRDSTFQPQDPRRQSQNVHATGGGVGGRKESHLYDGQSHQQRLARPSRASMPWHPRPSIGGSYRSGRYSNEDGGQRQGGQPVENTYRLDPTDGERFSPTKVEKLLDEFLANYLGGEQYDAQKCSQMALQMTDIIKERVKKMDFRRHKLYCHVVVGQNLGQGMQVSSRCLWDSTSDGSATATYCNNSLFAVATVFAVYYC